MHYASDVVTYSADVIDNYSVLLFVVIVSVFCAIVCSTRYVCVMTSTVCCLSFHFLNFREVVCVR